jgi:hypothetical protein
MRVTSSESIQRPRNAWRPATCSKPMCAQARQADARDLQRVDPAAAECVAARDLLEEGAIEVRAVRDDVSPADELDEPRNDAFDDRLTHQHLVGDAGELGDLERHRHHRIDERIEGLDHLRSAHHRSRDLDDSVPVEVVAGGLDIDHRDLVLEAKQCRPSALRQRLVGRNHVRISARNEEAMQVSLSHPPRVADGADIRSRDNAVGRGIRALSPHSTQPPHRETFAAPSRPS